MWRNWGARILDVLYPPVCACCGLPLSRGRSLCPDCDGGLPRLEPPFCRTCAEPFDGRVDGAVDCPRCLKAPPAYDFARAALRRNERSLELIHRLKYAREIHLGPELGRLAAGLLEDEALRQAVAEAWPLVPVPLHRGRLRRRHFNQSAEIARALSRHSGLPLLDALRRVRDTRTQTALGRRQRMENLKGAFALRRRGRRWLDGQKQPGVLLVDDVLTTGSTAHECARLLRKAGVGKVIVLAVMRG